MGSLLRRGCTSTWNDFPTGSQCVPLKQGELDVSAGEMMLRGQERNSRRHDVQGAFTPVQVVYAGGSSSTFAKGDFSWVGMEREEKELKSDQFFYLGA